MFQKLTRATALILAPAVLLPATALAAPAYQETACEQDYVVQAEDWLSKIADKFYGDVLAYPAIFEATNAMAATGKYEPIADPNTIEVGQTLCIPAAAEAEASIIPTGDEPEGEVITIPEARFFPEGVTRAADGTFYIGSMEEGSIYRAVPGAKEAEPFIAAGANGLVSVLGLLADDARGILWACSSDAGNSKLTGSAPVGVKAFDLKTGEAIGSYDFPGGGFCNDLTVDAAGNLYATDSWTPRILRLPAGGTALEEWVNDPQLGTEQWSLNGIDVDNENGLIYTVNQKAGQLFRIVIEPDGRAGTITEITTSQTLRRPDGLKVIGPNTLATAEGGAGGMAVIKLSGETAEVSVVSEGLDGVATFAFHNGSAWVVEGQADHFWDPANAGPEATPPFRLVEVPLNLS